MMAAADDEYQSQTFGGGGSSSSSSSSKNNGGEKTSKSMPSLDKIGIHIEVTDAEKHGEGLDAYVTFKVTTWTTWKGFGSEEFFVRRRYNDFAWLRDETDKYYSSLVTPPLPERYRLDYLDRFNPEFLERRRRALEKFLMRFASHPRLRDDANFRTFLEAKSWALETSKGSQMQNTLESMGNILKAAIAPKAKLPLDKLENIRNYTNEFEDNLGAIDKLMSAMLKRKADMAQDQNNLAAAMLLLGNSEVALTLPLQNIAHAFDLSATELGDMVSREDTSFVDPLKEYILAGENIRRVQRHADQLHVLYENNVLMLEAARKDKRDLEDTPVDAEQQQQQQQAPPKSGWASFVSKMEATFNDMQGVPPAQARAEKMAKLDAKIAGLESSLEENKKNHEECLASFIDEIDRFNTEKIVDFKKLLFDFVNDQVSHHKNSLAAWERCLGAVADIDPKRHALQPTNN